jgi:hypothetical protein
MAISAVEKRFGLDCHVEKPKEVFSDNRQELEEYAEKLLDGGRFKFLVLWEMVDGGWERVGEYE